MVCNAHVVNCGRNYEGLCLAPAPRPGAACVGFAASKADGHLYCLTEAAGKLVVHHDRAIAITRPGALADCAFGDDGTLWVGDNLFDLGRVYRVTHWEDPAHAEVEPVGVLSVGFPETIAVRGDVVYRMSDLGGAPSLMARFRCRR
jgi:outer membrane protein assembly factor BamB